MRDLLVWAGIGTLGALGAYGRFRIDSAVTSRFPTEFPVGTLVVNVSGAFVYGFLFGLSLAAELFLIVGTALLGGYTTFSTWMFESERLVEDGDSAFMWLNLVGSTAVGLAVAALGWWLGTTIS